MPPPEDAVRKFFDDDRLVERMLLVAPFQALPPLILTSRRMNQHAVPLVWRVLPSSIHLLNLIPGLFVRRGKWSLPGVVTRVDLQRFEYYAQFVFEVLSFFSTTCDGPRDIDPHTFNVLAQVLPTPFPQLRKVILSASFRRAMATPVPFFTPRLEEAHLFTPRRPSIYLEDLVDFSPSIHTLSLGGSLSRRLLSHISLLSTLTSLSLCFDRVPVLDSIPGRLHRFLSQLHTLPNISSLTLFTPQTEVLPLPLLPRGSLSSIRYLKLKGNVATFRAILRGTANLVEVVLFAFHEDSSDWHTCSTHLARTSARSLTSLTLQIGCFSIFYFGFTPLENVPNIRIFKVSARREGFLWLCDKDILMITARWPQLEYFVTPIDPQFVLSGLTLLAVDYLARLNNLRFVELQVAGETLTWPGTTSSDAVPAYRHMRHLMSDFSIDV